MDKVRRPTEKTVGRHQDAVLPSRCLWCKPRWDLGPESAEVRGTHDSAKDHRKVAGGGRGSQCGPGAPRTSGDRAPAENRPGSQSTGGDRSMVIASTAIRDVARLVGPPIAIRETPTPPRVLLVDDDEAVLEALQESLSSNGLMVVGQAHDGTEAVFLADALAPDVIVMDLRMPGMSGLLATRLIKAHHAEIQILVLTASPESSLRAAAEEDGVAGYLAKGAGSREIVAAVREAAAISRGRAG